MPMSQESENRAHAQTLGYMTLGAVFAAAAHIGGDIAPGYVGAALIAAGGTVTSYVQQLRGQTASAIRNWGDVSVAAGFAVAGIGHAFVGLPPIQHQEVIMNANGLWALFSCLAGAAYCLPVMDRMRHP